MAFEWATKLKNKIVEAASSRSATKQGTTPTSSYTIDAYQPPPTPPTPSWWDTLIDAWPAFMLVAGLLIAACTQLIGIWAILGYLLIVTSPVVHLLRKIERSLRR